MTGSEAWWQIFTLTGNIEAYLLYRGVLVPETLPEGGGYRYTGRKGVFLTMRPEQTSPGPETATAAGAGNGAVGPDGTETGSREGG